LVFGTFGESHEWAEVIASFAANCRQSINVVIAYEIGEAGEQRSNT
jgi:hypothetical protein